jgi:hypothetical protein
LSGNIDPTKISLSDPWVDADLSSKGSDRLSAKIDFDGEGKRCRRDVARFDGYIRLISVDDLNTEGIIASIGAVRSRLDEGQRKIVDLNIQDYLTEEMRLPGSSEGECSWNCLRANILGVRRSSGANPSNLNFAVS